MPKIFRMTSGGKLIEGIFEGETINTPSMICVEDYIVGLQWAKAIGGLKGLQARADANAAVIDRWIARTDWADHLAKTPATRSNTSVCFTLKGDADVPKKMAKLLEAEKVAYDINGHRDAPPGLRIWCGATVETTDLEALMPWLDWAYASVAA
jgi:phosphoserine aminotransferase